MVSTRFLSIRRKVDIERKCSLLGKFACNSLDRAEHERQVKQNLPTALCTAQKVKVKVGRDTVTVTDRTIWQHKLDRIPHSLISDAYVDRVNQQMCYFVNKADLNHYQLSAFLCKTAADARRLVEAYQCSARMMEGYNREMTRTYSQDCDQVYHGIQSSFPVQNHDNIQHSTMEAVVCHGNTAGRHQRMNNYTPKAKGRNHKMVHVNTDGVSRLMIGGNSPKSSSPYRDTGNLQRVTNSHSPPITYARQRSRSSSPVKRSNMVEEEFTFAPTDTYRSHSLPRHASTQDEYYSQSKRGLNLVRPNETNARRGRAPYGSILEYEEAQRNGTISSSGLHTTSSSDNIFSLTRPHMALVTRGDNYLIRDSAWPLQQKKMQTPAWKNKPIGLQLVQNGRFPVESPRPTRKSRSAEVRRTGPIVAIHPNTNHMKQPLQPVNQMQIYSPENIPQGQPTYRVQSHGKGSNYLKNEALEYDDDHKYFRQHGQRMKKTSDGKQQLFLDKRLAETRDIVGNQLVEGKHSQKVHSGETIGANHRSQFHSEVRTTHKISQPRMGGGEGQQSLHPKLSVHRRNSQPVRTITHQWPNPLPFDGPKLHFNENVGPFPTNEPLQRFFKPEYNPGADMRLNPGFERFFADIDNFGPKTNVPRIVGVGGNESQLALQSKPDNVDVAESETSSIRSSASAYWPPELKLVSTGNESDARSWKFRKPIKKLRRISPNRDRFER